MPGKKFKFALENVLKLRHIETEEARKNLASAVQACEGQEAVLDEANRRLADILSSSPTGTNVDPRSLKQYDSFRRDAQRAATDAQRELALRQRAAQEARDRLMERRRAEEALTNLRDEQAQEHKRTAEARDLAFIDEQAVSKYTRQKQF
jgi:flagellar protein FliJ